VRLAVTHSETLQVNPELIQAWEDNYTRTILPAAGPDPGGNGLQGNAGLLAAIRARIADVEQHGLVITVTGRPAYVGRPVAMPEEKPAAGRWPRATGRLGQVWLLLVAGAVVVILAAIFGPLVARTSRSAPAASASPTPGGEQSDVPVFVDVGAGNRKVPLDSPASIQIGDVPYQVVQGTVKVNPKTGSELTYPAATDVRMAVWLPSSANWLFALDDQVVRGVQVGDVVLVRTQAKAVHTFVVEEISDAQPQETEYLTQKRAGLTLFPLASQGTPVRVVWARYLESSLDQLAGAPADAALGAPLVVAGRTITVTGVDVQRQPSGLYDVAVRGEASEAFSSLTLDVASQQYASVKPFGPGNGLASFTVSALGPAQLVVLGKRVDLGELTAPRLGAELLAAEGLGESNTLSVTLSLTLGSGKAWLGPGDIALLSDAGSLAPARLWAPDKPETEDPSGVLIAAPGPVVIVAEFVLPRGVSEVEIKVLGQTWRIERSSH
jgi:hypothetical protein